LYDTSQKGKKIYWLLQESENGKTGNLEEAGKLLWEQITSPPDFSRPSLTPAFTPSNSLPPPPHAPPPRIGNTPQTLQYAPSGYNQPAGLPFHGKASLAVPTTTRMVDHQSYSGPYFSPNIRGAPTQSRHSQGPAQPTANPASWNHLPSYNSNTIQLPVLTHHQNPPSLPQTLNGLPRNTAISNTHNIGQSQPAIHPTTQVASALQHNQFLHQDKTLPFNLQDVPYNSQPEVGQLERNSNMNVQKTIPQVIITLPRATNPSASSHERSINTTSSVAPPSKPHPPLNPPNQEMTEIPQQQSQTPAQTPPIMRRPSSPFKRSFDPPTNNVQAGYSRPTSSGGVPLESSTFEEEHIMVAGAEVVGNGQFRVPCEEDDAVAKRRKL
jgi:hypothetical protein